MESSVANSIEQPRRQQKIEDKDLPEGARWQDSLDMAISRMSARFDAWASTLLDRSFSKGAEKTSARFEARRAMLENTIAEKEDEMIKRESIIDAYTNDSKMNKFALGRWINELRIEHHAGVIHDIHNSINETNGDILEAKHFLDTSRNRQSYYDRRVKDKVDTATSTLKEKLAPITEHRKQLETRIDELSELVAKYDASLTNLQQQFRALRKNRVTGEMIPESRAATLKSLRSGILKAKRESAKHRAMLAKAYKKQLDVVYAENTIKSAIDKITRQYDRKIMQMSHALEDARQDNFTTEEALRTMGINKTNDAGGNPHINQFGQSSSNENLARMQADMDQLSTTNNDIDTLTQMMEPSIDANELNILGQELNAPPRDPNISENGEGIKRTTGFMHWLKTIFHDRNVANSLRNSAQASQQIHAQMPSQKKPNILTRAWKALFGSTKNTHLKPIQESAINTQPKMESPSQNNETPSIDESIPTLTDNVEEHELSSEKEEISSEFLSQKMKFTDFIKLWNKTFSPNDRTRTFEKFLIQIKSARNIIMRETVNEDRTILIQKLETLLLNMESKDRRMRAALRGTLNETDSQLQGRELVETLFARLESTAKQQK